MKIGKSTVPRTAISTSDEHSITVRGEDLCRDLDRADIVHRLLQPARDRPAPDEG
jgi:hypothetical protein